MKMIFQITCTVIVLLSIACNKGHAGGSEDKALKEWDKKCQSGVISKSGLSRILAGESFVGIADGYQLWRGIYRGTSIALYSCMFEYSTFYQVEHPLEYPKDSLGVKFIRIILVADSETKIKPSTQNVTTKASCHRMPVAMQEYKGDEIDVAKYVLDPHETPTRAKIGEATVKIEDGGNGVLRFQYDGLKKLRWDSFDLEQVLKDFELKGEKRIIEPDFQQYTSEQFADVVLKIIAKCKYNSKYPLDNIIGGESEEILAHPMWDNSDAICAIIKKANNEQLVFILNIMIRKSSFNPRYMAKLENATQAILELANNDSKVVRELFASLLSNDWFWPRDIGVVESLLKSKYMEIVNCALETFINRNSIPSDMDSVRKIAKSQDEVVKFAAERLIRKADKIK